MPDSQLPSRFEFRSDLGQMPLPEVLVTVHRYKAPGVIDCSRDDVTKRIFIDSGNIIFATSSEISDSLGDRLLAEGRITFEQYRESVLRLLQDAEKRQGAILVEMRAIEPKELFVAVREQVRAIVWSLFEWEHGTVVFTPGRGCYTEFIKLNIPTPEAVLTGIGMVRDPKRLLARVGGRATVLQKTDDPLAADLPLSESQRLLLDAVDGKKTLVELTTLATGSPLQTARDLYALHTLRLVSVKPPKQLKVQMKMRG
jgi:hypothetical protein